MKNIRRKQLVVKKLINTQNNIEKQKKRQIKDFVACLTPANVAVDRQSYRSGDSGNFGQSQGISDNLSLSFFWSELLFSQKLLQVLLLSKTRSFSKILAFGYIWLSCCKFCFSNTNFLKILAFSLGQGISTSVRYSLGEMRWPAL